MNGCGSFSSLVKALAMINVQNGVVAFSTAARPAPSTVWPAKIRENGITLLVSASRKNRPAYAKATVAADLPSTVREKWPG